MGHNKDDTTPDFAFVQRINRIRDSLRKIQTTLEEIERLESVAPRDETRLDGLRSQLVSSRETIIELVFQVEIIDLERKRSAGQLIVGYATARDNATDAAYASLREFEQGLPQCLDADDDWFLTVIYDWFYRRNQPAHHQGNVDEEGLDRQAVRLFLDAWGGQREADANHERLAAALVVLWCFINRLRRCLRWIADDDPHKTKLLSILDLAIEYYTYWLNRACLGAGDALTRADAEELIRNQDQFGLSGSSLDTTAEVYTITKRGDFLRYVYGHANCPWTKKESVSAGKHRENVRRALGQLRLRLREEYETEIVPFEPWQLPWNKGMHF